MSDPKPCPKCGHPYAVAKRAGAITIDHEEAAQAATCVTVVTGDDGPELLVVFHRHEDLDGAAGGTETPAKTPDDRPDPTRLTDDHENVFAVVRSETHDTAATLAEVKGACGKKHDLSPSRVREVVNELVDGGYVAETEAGVVHVPEGVA